MKTFKANRIQSERSQYILDRILNLEERQALNQIIASYITDESISIECYTIYRKLIEKYNL